MARNRPKTQVSDEEAALMLIDLAHELQTSAPPRTWIQGPQQPGSRQCLQSLVRAASALRKRPLPYRLTSARRPAAIEAMGQMSDALGATGTWSSADPARRAAFAVAVSAGPVALPSPVLRIAKTGEVPFSDREYRRLEIRARQQ